MVSRESRVLVKKFESAVYLLLHAYCHEYELQIRVSKEKEREREPKLRKENVGY